VLRILYIATFVAFLLWLQPWKGGDGSIVFTMYCSILSFPIGLVAIAVSAFSTTAAVATPYEHFFCCSPFWWLFQGGACCLAGYVQWFVLVPFLYRRLHRQ